MASMFALILTVVTFITGVIWCLDKFKWAPARQRRVEAVRVETEGKVEGKILAEVGKAPVWVENLGSLFPILAVVFVIRSFIFEPFQIPSGSMMHTLLIGDFIAVEKFAYGIKDPITNKTLIKTGEPKRGDVVVFKYPKNPSLDYVKRIIGLPGDTIRYDAVAKTLTITPADSDRPLDLHYTNLKESEFFQVFERVNDRYAIKFYRDQKAIPENAAGVLPLLVRQETLGDKAHDILVLPRQIASADEFYQQDGQPPGQWVVPPGQYFAMGDNRDNSEDSRYWGFVPEKNLVGKAVAIWISFEKQPDEWPTGIRFNRIGLIH